MLSAARREHIKSIAPHLRFTLQNIQAARQVATVIDLRGGGRAGLSLTSRRTLGRSSAASSSTKRTLGATSGRRTLGRTKASAASAAGSSSRATLRPPLLGLGPHAATARQNMAQRAALARRLATTADWLCSPQLLTKSKDDISSVAMR